MQGKELSETTKLAQICSRRLWGGGVVGVGGGGGVVGVGLWRVL